MSTTEIKKQIRQMHAQRLKAARDAIEKAGGPAAMARALSQHLGRKVDSARVRKWRENGIPTPWGPVVECVVKGVSRETLNPWAYTRDPQVINNRGIANSYLN